MPRLPTRVVVGKGDWSIVEHAVVSVDMLVDRGITHEIVRHRLLSITQESTRFVNYEKKMPPSFIKPTGLTTVEHEVWWRNSIETAGRMYRDIVRSGVPPQIARSVFPNALASRLTFTCNLRNLRHLFLMRTTKEAHPQMRQVMIPLLEEAKQKIPILFDDIEPESRQIDNLRKPR
jgi:thymidylate synthase (FAD)